MADEHDSEHPDHDVEAHQPSAVRRLRRGVFGSGEYVAGEVPGTPAVPPSAESRDPTPPEAAPSAADPAPVPEPAAQAAAPEGQFQVIDGPVELQGIHDGPALAALVRSGRLAPTARAIDLGTMIPGSVGDLVGIDPVTIAAAPAAAGGAGPAASGPAGAAIVLGARQGAEGAFERFEARLRDGDRPVTALRSLEGASSGAIREMRTRLEAVRTIDHPSLMPVAAVEDQGGRLVVALEPIEGRGLSSMLFGSPPAPDQVATWVGQIANALWAAAKKGVHHLALGPDWIQLGRDGIARVGGFGSGGVVRSASREAWSRLAPYLAPEVLRGEAGDHRSDVYSLAALTYHLLGGKPPRPGSDPASIAAAAEAGPPEPLSERDKRIPAALDAELFQALDADPRQRPHSAMAFARALRDALDPAGGSGPRRASSSAMLPHTASPGPAPARRPSTHVNVALGGGGPQRRSAAKPILLVLLLAALGAGGWYGWREYGGSLGAPTSTDPAADPTSRPRPARTAPDEDPAPPTTDVDQGDPSTPAAAPGSGLPQGELDLLAAWQRAEESGEWKRAHELARVFALRFPRKVAAMRIHLPLVVESPTAGAVVLVDGVELGSGRVVHRYPPGSDALVVVHAPGHCPVASRLAALRDDWTWRPELAPLPSLRWLEVLTRPPAAGPVALDERRALVPLARDAAILGLAGGNQFSLRLADRAGPPLAPPLRRRDVAVQLSERALTALDPRRTLVLWSQPLVDAAIAGACLGPHELIPEQDKLWLADGRRLRCFVASGSQATELAATDLPAPASAPPAVVMVDSARSALAVPCGRRLAVFDGATVSHHLPCDPAFDLDLGAPLTIAPLALRHADRAWILLADDHQRLVAIDPAPEAQQRIAAEWYLPRPPAATPLRLGPDSARFALATDGGVLLAIDLERPGAVLWERETGSDLSGPPVFHQGRIYTAHVDGHLRCHAADDGRQVFEHALGLTPVGSPVVADGHLLVVTAERLALGLTLAD